MPLTLLVPDLLPPALAPGAGSLRLPQALVARRVRGGLITRLLAIIPAIIVIALYGERPTGQLLILSQVILSLQLPFAVFPLVRFTSDRGRMGQLVAPRWVSAIAWPVAVAIAGLNLWLLVLVFAGV